jgi:flagellar M-ring protein FliF
MAQLLKDLPAVWRALGRTRQALAIGAGAGVVLALIGAAFLLQRPTLVPLYTGLNEQDASAIVAKLKELKVPYSLSDGGTAIRVPQAAAADLRLQLAGQGLPSGSGVGLNGYELFDRTSLGITDFVQHLNRQRALEGELSRTIRRLSSIEDARVHLALPRESLFLAQQKETTASVVIKLRPGAKLSDEQVSTIRFLVSRSVEGLKPENVVVVDTAGNTLGQMDPPGAAKNRDAATRLEVQRQREAELERKLASLLEPVVGRNHAVVRASVELDWSQVEQRLEIFSPGNAQPQPRSIQDKRESFTGSGAEGAGAIGVPGTQANIPTYQVAPGGAQNSTYQSSNVVTNNELSSDRQQITRPPGDVKRLGIAVMVDQSVPAAQVDVITQVVSAAAGIQPQRGDQVSVVSLPFDDSLSAQLRAQESEQRKMEWIELGLKLLGIVLALGGMFMLFRTLTGAARPRQPAALPLATPAALPGEPAALPPPETGAVPGEPEGGRGEAAATEETEANERRRRAIEAELERREQIRQTIAEMIKQKPEVLAGILNSWLQQGDTVPAPRSTGGSTRN